MSERARARRLLARHGISPRRALGQNFVVDPVLIDRIVTRAEVDESTDVVEIGPGLGAMTRVLARSARRVVAVEKDESLIPVVRDQLGDDIASVRLVAGDATEIDWSELLQGGSEWLLVANLPYNVAVPLIMHVMRTAPMVTRAVVMVQKEVADRLTAVPGGRTIGAPTVHLAWYAQARTLMDVPPESFHPEPRVQSAVVEILRRTRPSQSIEVDDMMALVDTAFRQRRKMLRSSLGRLVPVGVFERAGIDPTSRPEGLSLHDWVRLTEELHVEEHRTTGGDV